MLIVCNQNLDIVTKIKFYDGDFRNVAEFYLKFLEEISLVTLTKIGKQIGQSTSMISQICAGKRKMNEESILLLSEILGLNASTVLAEFTCEKFAGKQSKSFGYLYEELKKNEDTPKKVLSIIEAKYYKMEKRSLPGEQGARPN